MLLASICTLLSLGMFPIPAIAQSYNEICYFPQRPFNRVCVSGVSRIPIPIGQKVDITLKGTLANNAETIEGGRQAGINAEITSPRTPNELGIKLTVRPNASRGNATLAVKYPLLFSSLWPKLAVTKVQNPIIRTIESIRGTDWSGGTSVQWPSCTDRDLTFDVTYQGSNLTVGPNMRAEFLAGGFQPYATMQILRSTPDRITVRYSFNDVPTGQWHPSGGISFWLRDVNDPNNHWAGQPPAITLPRPSECSARTAPVRTSPVGSIGSSNNSQATLPKPTVPNPIEPSNNASCVASAGSAAPPYDQTVSFKWEAADNVAPRQPYEVQVKQASANCPNNLTSSDLPRCHAEVVNTTETAVNLAADTSHAWRVRGVNQDNRGNRAYGDWSSWQAFRTRGSVEPPITTSPASNYCVALPQNNPNGPVPTGVAVQFEWQPSPCGDADYEYRVFRQSYSATNPWISGTTSLTQANVTLRIDPPPPPRVEPEEESSSTDNTANSRTGAANSEGSTSEKSESKKKAPPKPRTETYSWQVRAIVPWGISNWSPLKTIKLGGC